MVVKLKDLNLAKDVLTRLLNNPLEAKLSYRINKNTTKINNELQTIEKERMKLVEKYATQEEDITVDGKVIKGQKRVPQEKIE